MGLLITPTAEIKSKRAVHNDHNLRHALAEDQLCDYLVRNMGYIELAQAGPSLGIKFCPIKSPIVALDAVLTFIGGSKFENFCLLIFDGEKWTDLLIQDRCSVERVLVDLFDARIDSEAGRFICSDLEINRQAITPDIELALDLSNDDGITTSDEIFDYLNNAFKGRYMVVRSTDDQFRAYLCL